MSSNLNIQIVIFLDLLDDSIIIFEITLLCYYFYNKSAYIDYFANLVY